ncbi:MAG TPA: hypothetical protein VGM54_11165 [Chthoniobacter sp.]|jgi:hypothetical protein
MKISTVTILAAFLCLFAGCNSLTNPFAGLFHGHDERVYNPQTGEWEYPNKKGATPQPQKSAAVAAALASTPAPQGSPHSTDWVEKHAASPSAEPVTAAASNPNAPVNPSANSAATPPPAAPAPPPPRPGRATGYYNTQTGKIEWQSGVAPAAASPASTRHWWWPFGQSGETTVAAAAPAAATPAHTKHWWWPF